MPEWYKKRILQRPGQETQLITERPSEFYQLELPDFKIPTVTNSEDSVMTGLENRKWRDIWEHKGRVNGINNTDVTLQQEHPSLFLLPFAPEVMGSGLGLGVLKTLGGYAGSYVGSKIGNEVGYALDNTFNKQLFEPLGEIVGGFAGFGKGYNLFEKAGMQGALKYLSNTGKEIPRWFMRPELRTNIGRINQRTFFAEDQTPKYNSNQLPRLNKRYYQSLASSQLEIIPQATFASKGSFTGYDPEMYLEKPMQAIRDIKSGRQDAWAYLGSKEKQQLDEYNESLLKRIFESNEQLSSEPFMIEKNPQLRSMTSMKKPTPIMQKIQDATWLGNNEDGLFIFHPKGEIQGETHIFEKLPASSDQMYLNTRTSLDDSAFHEYLHRGKVGDAKGLAGWLYQWKMKKLMKPLEDIDPQWREYAQIPQEAVNFIEIGRKAGITNVPFPGPGPAKIIIKHIIDNDSLKGGLLNSTKWETKPKRVWDALQGKYIGLAPIGLGASLMLNNNEND